MEETINPDNKTENGGQTVCVNEGGSVASVSSVAVQGENVNIDSVDLASEEKDPVEQIACPNEDDTCTPTVQTEVNSAQASPEQGKTDSTAIPPEPIQSGDIEIDSKAAEHMESPVGEVEQVMLPPPVPPSSSDEPSKMDSPEETPPDDAGEANNSMEVEDLPAGPSKPVTLQDQIAEQQQLESEAVNKINNSSLSLLCQYSGSSESESEANDTAKSSDIEKRTVRSSSTSSSDESDDEPIAGAVETSLHTNYRERDDSILVSDAETMDTNAVSSDDEEDDQSKAPIRTKGEILVDELPPIEELTITVPETECKPIGLVDSIVAQIVLVQSVPGVELLNLETVLFLDRGKRPLGKIFDVIGQVNCPIYCVLFNSNQEVVAKNITVGMEVFCAPRTEHTSFIILSELMRYKGSDASWMNDNEPPPHMVEYSDDEVEQSVKRNRKKKSNPNAVNAVANTQQDPQFHQQRQPYQQFQHPPFVPRPQFRRPPPNNRRNFQPHPHPSHSWHHNFNNPRHYYPQQHPHPPQQQMSQQMPPQAPPSSAFLPNPFAVFGQQPPAPPS